MSAGLAAKNECLRFWLNGYQRRPQLGDVVNLET